MKEILSVMIVVLLIFISVGCSKSSSESSGSDESDVSILSFIEKEYTIIRPENDSNIAQLAMKVFQAIKQSTGVRLVNTDDYNRVSDNGEILIGNTNRPESAEAYDRLLQLGTGRAAEYIICVINGNIVIQAMSYDALETAVDRFIADYCDECTVRTDLQYVFTDTEGYVDMSIGNTNIGNYTVVIPEYNLSYIVKMKIDEMLKEIYEKSGYMLNVVKDSSQNESECEIVIDNCNRNGVKSITERDSYEIRFEDEKVYINGGRNYSTAYAVELFFKNIVDDGSVNTENTAGKYTEQSGDGEYRLVWNDDFDTLDTTKWRIKHGEGSASYGGWFGRSTFRSADNVSVDDSKLYITGTYDDSYFYGAWMDTSQALNFTYGYIEMSARAADGDGIWHDLWTWSDEPDHLEFDIMECWGPGDAYVSVIHEFIVDDNNNRTDHTAKQVHVTKNKVYSSAEWWGNRPEYKQDNSFWNEFHTYGCEWTEDKVTFFRDGEEMTSYAYTDAAEREYDREYLYRKPHYLILSMLVGSNYSNSSPEDITASSWMQYPKLDADYWTNGRASFIVEYVQLYQKPGQYLSLN